MICYLTSELFRHVFLSFKYVKFYIFFLLLASPFYLFQIVACSYPHSHLYCT